jgi:hypothetical protein
MVRAARADRKTSPRSSSASNATSSPQAWRRPGYGGARRITRSLKSGRPGPSCLTRAAHGPIVSPHEIPGSGISHRNAGSSPRSGTEEGDISPVFGALEHAAGDFAALGTVHSLECSSPPSDTGTSQVRGLKSACGAARDTPLTLAGITAPPPRGNAPQHLVGVGQDAGVGHLREARQRARPARRETRSHLVILVQAVRVKRAPVGQPHQDMSHVRVDGNNSSRVDGLTMRSLLASAVMWGRRRLPARSPRFPACGRGGPVGAGTFWFLRRHVSDDGRASPYGMGHRATVAWPVVVGSGGLSD